MVKDAGKINIGVNFFHEKCADVTDDGHHSTPGTIDSEPCASNIQKETEPENASPMNVDSDVELIEIKKEPIVIGDDDKGLLRLSPRPCTPF